MWGTSLKVTGDGLSRDPFQAPYLFLVQSVSPERSPPVSCLEDTALAASDQEKGAKDFTTD